jgi:hypothetical protein
MNQIWRFLRPARAHRFHLSRRGLCTISPKTNRLFVQPAILHKKADKVAALEFNHRCQTVNLDSLDRRRKPDCWGSLRRSGHHLGNDLANCLHGHHLLKLA